MPIIAARSLHVAEPGAQRGRLDREVGRKRFDRLADLADERGQRRAAIARDLAEEQVERLDVRRAFVQRVDLLVADVLLDRIILAVAAAAEDLQRHREQLVDLLAAVALDQRQHEIVERIELRVLALPAAELDAILNVRGPQHHAAQALGERLLQHQHAAHVGMADDLDARRTLVGLLLEGGALHANARVLERVAVRGRQRRHRLGADAHARVLDDVEHLLDAVVDLAEQEAATRRAVAERELAGRARAQAHLVLDLGDDGPVARAELAVGLDPELGHDEQGQALGAGPGAFGPREHHVHDVGAVVEVAVGDEALDALEQVLVARDVLRARRAGADIAPRVRLGQHHGRAPVAVEHVLHVALLLRRRAELVDHLHHEVAEQVEAQRRVAAREHLERGPLHARRGAEAAELLGQLELVPAAAVVCLERLAIAGRQLDVAARAELDARAIAAREDRRPRRQHDLEQAIERRARGRLVHLAERPLAERGALDLEDLEELEERVAKIRPVVMDGRHALLIPLVPRPRLRDRAAARSIASRRGCGH